MKIEKEYGAWIASQGDKKWRLEAKNLVDAVNLAFEEMKKTHEGSVTLTKLST